MNKKIQILFERWSEKLNKTDNNNEKIKIQNNINQLKNFNKIIDEIAFCNENLKNEQNKEMQKIYHEEIKILEELIEDEFEKLKNKIINNEKQTIIMEIRSGEGGQEAELFALELYEMYEKTCKKQGWDMKILNFATKESGGLKEGFFEISANGINLWLENEAGVHCVKRVPKTEKKGRIHTSTASVAILKVPNEVEIIINEKDLKIDVFRSSGPGGQSVNTTDSAVRITHLPTNIVVSQQDEKSQHKNKEKALKILKARIFAKKQEEENAQYAKERKEAIGTAKRNERIRTYHFTQNWVNDSRIEIKSYDINNFMEGTDLIKFLNELIFFSL